MIKLIVKIKKVENDGLIKMELEKLTKEESKEKEDNSYSYQEDNSIVKDDKVKVKKIGTRYDLHK